MPDLSTHLFEKTVNQPGFANENKKNSIWQSLSWPGICTHSYLPVLYFITQIIINKNEHKADLLLHWNLKNTRWWWCYYFLVIDCIFLETFQFHSKIEVKVQKFPISALPSFKGNHPYLLASVTRVPHFL